MFLRQFPVRPRTEPTGVALDLFLPGISHQIFNKLLLVGFLTLALLIPLSMVEGVINQRSWRHKEVLADIARQHSEEQRIVGPFLLAPYLTKTSITVPATNDIPERQRHVCGEGYAVILPENPTVFANLAHTMRERGVYSAPV